MKKSELPPQNRRKSKNRRNKVVIEFDEKKRTEYLTGFSKRKNERKKRAKEEEIKQLKEEKRNIRLKKKAEYTSHLAALRVATTEAEGRGSVAMPTIVKETTRECGATHSVTVAELDLTGGTTPRLGDNDARYHSSGEDETGCPEDEEPRAKRVKNVSEKSTEVDLVKLRHADREKDGRKKKKKQKKRHISYTHALHRPKKATAESRLTTKRKVKRQAKRAKH